MFRDDPSSEEEMIGCKVLDDKIVIKRQGNDVTMMRGRI
jgi:hypothetical protein